MPIFDTPIDFIVFCATIVITTVSVVKIVNVLTPLNPEPSYESEIINDIRNHTEQIKMIVAVSESKLNKIIDRQIQHFEFMVNRK